jgi:endonuclease G
MSAQQEQVLRYLERVIRKNREGVRALTREAQQEGPETGQVDRRSVAAEEAIDAIEQDRLPTPEQQAGAEAIILPKIRPVLDVVDGDFQTDHPLWVKLNADASIRTRLKAAIPAIGRIELPGQSAIPYGGTGFIVGDRLVMTNRHVAAIFTSGLGTRSVTFKPGARAGIDLRRELERPTGPTLALKRVLMVHPYWDMALLELESMPEGVQPLRLAQVDPALNNMIEVAAIGYPAFDSRNDASVQNDLFRRVFGVKRLQPGTIGGRRDTASFGKTVSALGHNCSTLGGNSGSALIDLSTGHVVALHFGGLFKQINFSVPAIELSRDGRVVDAGVQFATTPPGGTPPWESWWENTEGTASAISRPPSSAPGRSAAAPIRREAHTMAADGSIQFPVTLYVSLRLGTPSTSAGVEVTAASASAGEMSDMTEGMVMPWHDDNYDSRSGYDPDFLGTRVPMPTAASASVVAKTKDGNDVLHYENFSIVMHARRRLALFTASNVTAEARLKQPDPSKSYTRKELSGLGKNDQERWFPDPRLADEFQLPDVFYTRDDGAFDKGHIVRREDVAWGTSYKAVRIANGDTYHVTNCSPQVAGFNQSSQGEDNWGDLENHVLKSAVQERYCQFAGPILDPRDDTFIGRAGGRATVRVKIPSRYWKVIVAETDAGLASYAFVQEQDLSDVPLEFVVGAFRQFMVSIPELEQLAGIRFPEVVRNADQITTDEGTELAFKTGSTRRGEGIAPEESVIR